MRVMNLLLLTIVFILGVSCSKEELKSNDEILTEEERMLKSRLVGTWIEISPCSSCSMFKFTETDSIFLEHTLAHDSLTLKYTIIGKDSIRVTRNWEIEKDLKETTHNIIFYSNDTLEIIKFSPVDYGVFGFEDIKLYKYR